MNMNKALKRGKTYVKLKSDEDEGLVPDRELWLTQTVLNYTR